MPVPQYDMLFNSLLKALKKLGGSATIAELDEEVVKNLDLTPEEIAQPHSNRETVIEYRLAWARTYLKQFGVITNSSRGVWSLTAMGHEIDVVDRLEVTRSFPRKKDRKVTSKDAADKNGADLAESHIAAENLLEQSWKEQLLSMLLALEPDAFERLCQRMLRESGFIQVRVTGRSGDGGIDGVGLVQLGGLLSFPVIFQCKRYQGSIGPGIIRDFRGAMIGRADRGLVITTGRFSRDAKLEATRDGAPPVDLVDGDQLMEKLKELKLGVTVKMIEEVTVLSGWFKDI